MSDIVSKYYICVFWFQLCLRRRDLLLVCNQTFHQSRKSRLDYHISINTKNKSTKSFNTLIYLFDIGRTLFWITQLDINWPKWIDLIFWDKGSRFILCNWIITVKKFNRNTSIKWQGDQALSIFSVAANQLLLVVTENWEGQLRTLHSIITMTFQVDGACFILKRKSGNIGFVEYQLGRNGYIAFGMVWCTF